MKIFLDTANLPEQHHRQNKRRRHAAELLQAA